jgi:hypothetical protein
MTASRNVRLAAAAVLGLAAGGALWARASEIQPYLEIEPYLVGRTDEFEWWEIQVKPRGGETIDLIRIETGDGPVRLSPEGSRELPNLHSGWTGRFRVQLDGPRGTKGSVRLVQSGRVPRTYVVPLEVKE